MATLESGFNPTYSENASILTGNPNRVTVEVEDTIDRDFWSDLLGELCPEKEFHFDPYHTILNEDGTSEQTGKGKSQIINASADFNAWHIGCVDSDYDWILSDYTDAGKTISGNKYLLQTYAYSIENLMCLSCTLGDLCSENTEEATEFDFDDYLTRLSKTVYPLFVWSTYLCSKGNQDGHDLFDHILYSVLNPVITKLRNQHYAALRASGTDEGTRKTALREYQAKDKPVEKMLSKNYRYKNNTLIYKQIWADVMQIWM